MKAVPYIETVGNEAFRKFVTQLFEIEMIPQLFERLEKRGGFTILVNEKITLQFFDNYYKIVSTEKDIDTYELPLPETINDFVGDFVRMKIPLNWSKKVTDMFMPPHYLPQNQLEDYYKKLLGSLDKEHELLIGENDEK